MEVLKEVEDREGFNSTMENMDTQVENLHTQGSECNDAGVFEESGTVDKV